MTHSNRRPHGLRRLLVGFVIGFVAGSATLSTASFGKKGWERFGPMFKQGYIAGFIDCVHIAQAIDPFSYIATQYPAPLQAKPLEWTREVDELYSQDLHKERPMSQLLMIVGAKLRAKYPDKLEPGDTRLEALRQAIDKQRRALLQQKKTVEAAQDELKKGSATNADAKSAGKGAASTNVDSGAVPKSDPAAGAADAPKDSPPAPGAAQNH